MDVDSEQSRTPSFLGYFDVSNVSFAWREPRPQQIEQRRAALGDLLIFDILLSSGGIREPYLVYPPNDVEGLVRLLKAIEVSHYDTLKKDCLVYFLLKWHQDGREDRFQGERCIPPQFTALADAYWHLDTGINIARGVSLLSDARLNRDYASKILHALSLSPYPAPLILKYVRTAKPPLTEPDDLDIYILALAESSLLEAWQFQRTFNDTNASRTRLLTNVLEWCITPQPRPRPLAALLSIPLSQFEETLIHNYALDPPSILVPASIAALRDLICVRLIQSGRYVDAIKINHQLSSSPLNESKNHTQERKMMIQDLYSALSPAERSVLDTELELFAKGKSITNAQHKGPLIPSTNGNDAGISQSWEDVPRPTHIVSDSVNGRATGTASPFHDIIAPIIPIPERSGAPRFGGPILSTPVSTPAPLIPISVPAAGGARSTPRKSFPLASIPLSNSAGLSSRPRQSLATGSGLTLSQSTSQPLAASTSSGHGFESATRKQNAFYQPPPTKVNEAKRPFEMEGSMSPGKRASPGLIGEANVGMDLDDGAPSTKNGKPDARELRGEESEGGDEEDIRAELGFSVFGNEPPRQTRQDGDLDATRKNIKTPEKPDRKVPPGAFLTDEEEDVEDEHVNEKPRPSRRRAGRAAKADAPAAKQKPRTSHLKDQALGRSLPGSLMDDEEEEEDDYVAPLRAPSPPRRPTRKARSSTSSDLGDGDNGAPARRRSSRLSTTGSVHAVSPEPPSPKRSSAAKTRRKTSSATKRK